VPYSLVGFAAAVDAACLCALVAPAAVEHLNPYHPVVQLPCAASEMLTAAGAASDAAFAEKEEGEALCAHSA
jgi:hypothetical protein